MALQIIDPVSFRRTLGHYASGITVVTGRINSAPVGFTCQSFHSVSKEPPLISICVMMSSTSWPKISATGHFCVNVLSSEQRHISDSFARSGTDKWAGIEWSSTGMGNPVIDDVLAWIDCELESEHVAGDHIIALGRVLETSGADAEVSRQPLLFYKGQYHQLAD